MPLTAKDCEDLVINADQSRFDKRSSGPGQWQLAVDKGQFPWEDSDAHACAMWMLALLWQDAAQAAAEDRLLE